MPLNSFIDQVVDMIRNYFSKEITILDDELESDS